MRNFHEQQTFQLKPIINRVYERECLIQIQTVCFNCSIQQQKLIFRGIVFNHLCKSFENKYKLIHTNLRVPHQHHYKSNVISNCNIILTIMQSLVGFNQPSTTQSTKTLGNDHVFVKSSNFESNNYISKRNFHEQQNIPLKPIINCVYERASLFQIQTICFICSIQQQNLNFCKFSLSFGQKIWKRV